MDAVAMLMEQHRQVESLFAQYEQLGAQDYQAKQQIVDQIIQQLQIHSQLEEQIFYPAFKQASRATDEVYEALEEHNLVDFEIAQIDSLPARADTFDVKVHVLKELVMHHVQEEESTMLPQARAAMAMQLDDLAQQMMALKRTLIESPESSVTITKRLEVKSRKPSS